MVGGEAALKGLFLEGLFHVTDLLLNFAGHLLVRSFVVESGVIRRVPKLFFNCAFGLVDGALDLGLSCCPSWDLLLVLKHHGRTSRSMAELVGSRVARRQVRGVE
jgi:hypothetical protein